MPHRVERQVRGAVRPQVPQFDQHLVPAARARASLATRLDPALTVYETLQAGSPTDMVPTIRSILGGFLFSGDDVYKKVAVLSGGERTRLAVARMLLRPSNTLLLDEPTNHLDLESKDVLLEAIEDYGGTLVFVSHDRYFVGRLATKIETDRRRTQRALDSLQKRIADLEGRIAAREAEVKAIEAAMSAPGFYDRPDASKPMIDRHQALMWKSAI